jgi:hypothetical protein
MLAENRAGDHDRRHAADLFTDGFPAPALLALDVEQLLGEVGAGHDVFSLVVISARRPADRRRSIPECCGQSPVPAVRAAR